MKERKFKHYLTIEFPDNFPEEHINKLKQSIQAMLDIGNRGCIVKKVDYITSNSNANVPSGS